MVEFIPAATSVYLTGDPRCLDCGMRCDGAARIGTVLKYPKNGDFSVCSGCGNVAVFMHGPFGYALRARTDTDWTAFKATVTSFAEENGLEEE